MRYMRSGAYGVCMINNNEEGTSRGFMLSFELHLTAYLCYPHSPPFNPLFIPFSPAFHAERAGQDWDVKTHQAAALEIN